MSKSKLQSRIDVVNRRYRAGLNDDDQVVAMVEEDKRTKGWSFYPGWDTYELITDREKLKRYVAKSGYPSKEVERLIEILKEKGGLDYVHELNKEYSKTPIAKPQ